LGRQCRLGADRRQWGEVAHTEKKKTVTLEKGGVVYGAQKQGEGGGKIRQKPRNVSFQKATSLQQTRKQGGQAADGGQKKETILKKETYATKARSKPTALRVGRE